jgi:hypothetical protein
MCLPPHQYELARALDPEPNPRDYADPILFNVAYVAWLKRQP